MSQTGPDCRGSGKSKGEDPRRDLRPILTAVPTPPRTLRVKTEAVVAPKLGWSVEQNEEKKGGGQHEISRDAKNRTKRCCCNDCPVEHFRVAVGVLHAVLNRQHCTRNVTPNTPPKHDTPGKMPSMANATMPWATQCQSPPPPTHTEGKDIRE